MIVCRDGRTEDVTLGPERASSLNMGTQPNPQQGTLPQGTEKTIRLARPSVVVLCGPAACGKSTFAERHFRPTQIISSDWARERVCDDAREQRYQAQAFALVRFLIEQRLSLNRLCVVDSTALTPQARKDLLDLARQYQVPCIALLFDISLEKCLERDRARERTVGRPVIERQHLLFQQAKATIRQEGFEQVIDLLDEDLDKARIEIIFRPIARPATGPARPGPGTWRRPTGRGGPGPGGPTPRTPAKPQSLERAATAQTSPPSVPPLAGTQTPIASTRQPSESRPVGTAPAATPKPDVSGPAAGLASPPLSQGAGKPPLPPGTSSGGPPEQGKA